MSFGKIVESNLLGEVNKRPNSMEGYSEGRRKEIQAVLKEQSRMTFMTAIRVVKAFQPSENPSDPNTQFANDLHATLAEKLGLEDYDDLGYYTSVGFAPLDNRGVDAFFEYRDKKTGKLILATLDITTNPQKGDSYKADVIMLVPRDGIDRKVDKKEYIGYIDKFASDIAEVMLEKRGRYEK